MPRNLALLSLTDRLHPNVYPAHLSHSPVKDQEPCQKLLQVCALARRFPLAPEQVFCTGSVPCAGIELGQHVLDLLGRGSAVWMSRTAPQVLHQPLRTARS